MWKKKAPEKKFFNDKYLRNTVFLLYENYEVSEEELEKCKRIVENLKERSKSVSG